MSAVTPADRGPAEETAAPGTGAQAPHAVNVAATAPEPPADPDLCAACGTRLDPDQEWCLECGLGRTIIHAPPDWRPAALVIGVVVVAALVAVAIALINLGSPSSTPTAGATRTVTVTRTVAAPRRPAALLDWPPGLSGWTVVLSRNATRRSGNAAARAVLATGVRQVGVVVTSEHPRLRPGGYDVFVGRYPSETEAQAAAAALAVRGHAGGMVVEIAAPGGI